MDSRLRGNDENVKTLYPFQHQRSRRLGAADDPGDTCARMRPRADEVKIGNRVVPLVGAEPGALPARRFPRSEEHTSELQSLMRISYAVFCLKKNKEEQQITRPTSKH